MDMVSKTKILKNGANSKDKKSRLDMEMINPPCDETEDEEDNQSVDEVEVVEEEDA